MQCAITDMQAQEGEGSRGESQTIPARPGPGVGFCKTGLSVLKKKKKKGNPGHTRTTCSLWTEIRDSFKAEVQPK